MFIGCYSNAHKPHPVQKTGDLIIMDRAKNNRIYFCKMLFIKYFYLYFLIEYYWLVVYGCEKI